MSPSIPVVPKPYVAKIDAFGEAKLGGIRSDMDRLETRHSVLPIGVRIPELTLHNWAPPVSVSKSPSELA